ncbi:MAG: DPP IV N-terminal domain-containing protein, partial [Myxococcales bacterium]|nr:DPP IV N-terminal domain-containing protein [Myxococcales bacterium]
KSLLFLRSGPRSFVRNLYEIDLATGQEKVLLTAGKLLAGVIEKLSDAEKARRERMRLAARGLVSFRMTRDGRFLLLPLSGKLYLYERATGKVRVYASKAGYPVDPRLSPDGKKIAMVRDGDLYVTDLATGKERRLTTKKPGFTYGAAEFVAQEEMGRMKGYWWSPDSQQLLFQETDEREVEWIYLPNAAKPQREPYKQRYPRPGKKNAIVRLGILSLKDGKARWIEWDRKKFPYLNTVKWPKRGPLTLLLQDRLQRHARLVAVDLAKLSLRTLLEERDDAWLNIDQSVPHWLPDGKSFLWSTERSGDWRLELHDQKGALLQILTPPAMRYRSLLAVDAKRGCAYISASPEPTEGHIYRIPLQGEQWKIQRLTYQKGVYRATFGHGKSALMYVLSASTMDAKTSYTVRRLDPPLGTGKSATSKPTVKDAMARGKVLAKVLSRSEDPGVVPQVKLFQVGPQKLRAAVTYPHDFNPRLSYPTLLYVYAGPGYRMVSAVRGHYLFPQWLANQGFLVVSVDGRGTPGRSRVWERAIQGDFISKPLEDQVAGLRAVAQLVPQIDLKRVGVYGWSFGGYFSVMATLRRPDVFRAGVAGAPVTDWMDYDTHYTERFLGLPQKDPQAYKRSNAILDAPKLQRPLLLIHGTADDNVFFLHSLKLSHALLLAQKAHDFLPLSNMTHMVRRARPLRALNERLIRFFLRHLGKPKTK